MVSAGVQILGISLGIIGWIGAIFTCALPQWKVTAFVDNNIITAQTAWEGIWMNCMVQSTGQMQCKVYDSMLALGTDLKVSRALIIISILSGIIAILLSVAGGKCTNCVEDEGSKAKVIITAGALFIIAGLLCLIPVSYTAHITIQEFYNPMFNAKKMELGPALFIGWVSATLLILGGGLLCSNCAPKDENISHAKIVSSRTVPPNSFV